LFQQEIKIYNDSERDKERKREKEKERERGGNETKSKKKIIRKSTRNKKSVQPAGGLRFSDEPGKSKTDNDKLWS
jgi:hypothetical protein